MLDDPLSLVVWLPLLFSLAMTPAGLLLSGCACCGDGCPWDVEFDRCIRFKKVSPANPPDVIDGTTFIHGFSVPVRKPAEIGVSRVCSVYEYAPLVRIKQAAGELVDGQTQSLTFTLKYLATIQLGEVLESDTAAVATWRVKIVGKTEPSGNDRVVEIDGETQVPSTLIRGRSSFDVYLPAKTLSVLPSQGYLGQPDVAISQWSQPSEQYFQIVNLPNSRTFKDLTTCLRYDYAANIGLRWGGIFSAAGSSLLRTTSSPSSYEDVLAFLRGERPITVTLESNDEQQFAGEWEVSVSQPTAFCGVSACDISYAGIGTALSATAQFPVEPNATTYADERGPRTVANMCPGHAPPPINMRRLDTGLPRYANNICGYYGEHSTCENRDAALEYVTVGGNTIQPPYGYGSPTNFNTSAALSEFYCGDLLWVIENGPCKSSRKIRPAYLVGSGDSSQDITITIGGDDDKPWKTGLCWNGTSNVVPSNDGKCSPAEITFQVQETELKNSRGENTGCSVPGGDYVLPFGVGSQTGFFGGLGVFGLPGGGYSCNNQSTAVGVRLTGNGFWCSDNGRFGGFPGGYLGVIRQRAKWCDDWSSAFGLGPTDVFWAAYFYQGTDAFQNAPVGAVVGTSTGWDDGPEETEFTATASPDTLPVEGGTVSVTFCCPEITRTYTVPPPFTSDDRRYDRTVLINPISQFDTLAADRQSIGNTAYVTRAGYKDECRFTWQSEARNIFTGRIDASRQDGLCAYVQVNILEGPKCEWEISAQSADWFTAARVTEGEQVNLIKVLVDANTTPESRTGTFTIRMPSGYSQDVTIFQP